jgi:hypothetical protein
MSNYRKVKIPKKNLPIEIDSLEFKDTWIYVLSNKNSDLTQFLNLLEPFISFVEDTLRFKKQPPSFFLISLLSYIDLSPEVSSKKLKKWIKENDVREEIIESIISRVRSLKKIPYKAKPLMAEYFFVLDIKYSLSKKIQKTNIQTINIKNSFEFYEINSYFDIKTGNPWYDYLLNLYSMGYNNTEISEITKLSRKTIIAEGEKLWQCLKQKL